jgi:hypothetical protein
MLARFGKRPIKEGRRFDMDYYYFKKRYQKWTVSEEKAQNSDKSKDKSLRKDMDINKEEEPGQNIKRLFVEELR